MSEALSRAPSLSALRHRLAAAEEQVISAGSLPNPMLEVMVQDVGIPRPTDMAMAVVEFRQELPYPGKRAAREDSATAEVTARKAEVVALKTELAKMVRTLYARIYSLDSERQTLLSGHDLLQLLSSAVAARYVSGQAEMEALLKTRLNLSRLEERGRDLDSGREKLQAALNRLLDRPGDQSIRAIPALPQAEPLLPGLLDEALSHAPMLAVKRANLITAQRRIEQARLEAKPDFTIGAGGGITYGVEPVAILRFGVGLPIWPSNREPAIRAAERELDAARDDLRDAEAEVRSEVASLISEWSLGQDQVKRYRNSIIPQVNEAMDAAKSSYLSGRGDFSMVIEDFNAWLEARFQLAQREAGLFMTSAQIKALTSDAAVDEPGTGRIP